MEAPILILLILTSIAVLFLIVRFITNLAKYDYLGNVYLYIVAAYVICFVFSCFVNFGDVQVPYQQVILNNGTTGKIVPGQESKDALIKLGSSLFDALKMMAAKFDQDVAKAYVAKEGYYAAFGYYYAGVSIFALITTSIVTMLFAFKSFGAKFKNFFRKLCPKKEIYYIFSDPEVQSAAINLAEELRNDKEEKKIVVMFIPSASLKTQQGTEYRDALKNKGFDVRSENFSEKLCKKIVEEHFERRFRKLFLFPWKYYGKNRKVTVFGLFSKDEYSTELAINFTKALANKDEPNKQFLKVQEKVVYYKNNPNAKSPEEVKAELKEKKKKENLSAEKKVELKAKQKVKKTKLTKEERKQRRQERRKAKQIPSLKLIKTYLRKLDNFKVFVTYQDADMDLINNFSGRTLHIVNTLSQYDMISSEFILNNPIQNFINIKTLDGSKLDSLNISFLGFGKVNRPIFEKMTFAYQLWGDKKYLINYHILDAKANECVKAYSNEFTKEQKDKEKDYLEKPVLYHIDAVCDGEDLSSYETIDKHVLEISKGKYRFEDPGFEVFVISLCNTHTDIKVALQLRQALIKHIKPTKLNKTIIFVRVGSESIGNAFKEQNSGFVVDQKTLSETRLEGLTQIVPIVLFGQNTTMSSFVKQHYETLNKLSFYSLKAYKSDIKDEDRKTRASQADWITDKKTIALGNIGPVYALKTKLEIFGVPHNKNFEVADDLKNDTKHLLTEIESLQKTCEANFGQVYSSEYKLMKLAELEHNRWLAATYLYYKPTRMSVSKYFAMNEDQFNGKRFKSRDAGTTIHICMTTNQGLKDLYKMLEEKSKNTNIVKKENKTKFDEESIKLVFRNDIEQLKEALKYFNDDKK